MSRLRRIKIFIIGFLLGMGSCLAIIAIALGDNLVDHRPIISTVVKGYIAVVTITSVIISTVQWFTKCKKAN